MILTKEQKPATVLTAVKNLGRKQFRTDSGEATRNLKQHEERTAAVETMLTLVLVIFSYFQVITPIAKRGIFTSDLNLTLFLVFTFIATSVLTVAALIGGKNMVSVIRRTVFEKS